MAPSKSKGKMIPVLAKNNLYMLKNLIKDSNFEGGKEFLDDLVETYRIDKKETNKVKIHSSID
jgi:hypothetical protein